VPGQYLAIDPKGRAVMIGECALFVIELISITNIAHALALFRTEKCDADVND